MKTLYLVILSWVPAGRTASNVETAILGRSKDVSEMTSLFSKAPFEHKNMKAGAMHKCIRITRRDMTPKGNESTTLATRYPA